MKTNRFIYLIFAAFIVVTFSLPGYAEKPPASVAILPPTNGVIAISVTETSLENSAQSVTADERSAAPSQWIDIKNFTVDQRKEFFVGLEKLETIVNRQINELTARRAATKVPAERNELDLVIQNMDSARFFLAAMGELLVKSTPQTWEKQKLKVGLAWVKTQEAYAKANANPSTS